MRRIGVISAFADGDWHAQRIARAASARAEAVVLSPLDFTADMRPGALSLSVRGEHHSRYAVFLLPRAIGDEGDAELQLSLYQTLAEEGAVLVNDVRALTTAIDKFRTSWLLARAGLPTPRALVVQRVEDIGKAIDTLGGDAVAKPLYGSLGIGVERVGYGDEERLAERLRREGALYLQRFAGDGRHDLRVFVVGGRVAAAIARRAPRGEFRTNVHQGGQAEAVRISRSASALSRAAAAALGLDYAGVDLVETEAGPTILEVNGAPLFRGILQATGRDMADAIVSHALRKAGLRARRRPPAAERQGDSNQQHRTKHRDQTHVTIGRG